MSHTLYPFELFAPELPICTWIMDPSLKVIQSAGGITKNTQTNIWESPTLKEAAKQVLTGNSVSFTMDWEGSSYEVWMKPYEKGIAGFALDVTERKILETQRTQSQPVLALGRLVGGIAHDFNNLLTVIMNYTELLENDCKSVPSARPKLDAIAKCSQQAVFLTSQLLTYSRAQKLKEQTLQLNMLLSSATHMLKRIIGDDITLEVHWADNLDSITTDPYQLLHVVMTLVENARDAMPNGGKLSIQTSKNTDQVALTISASGQEFDEKSEPHKMMFDALAHILKQLGASINVASKQGTGSTFTISFPIKKSLPPLKPETTANSPGGSHTILVVEDEEIVRQITCDIIRSEGYNVIEATNAINALELCENSPKIDLVITDLMMPKMNGPEFIKKLSETFPKINVVYMSGYDNDAAFSKGLTDKKASFIQKPFLPKALLKAVKDTLGSQIVAQS